MVRPGVYTIAEVEAMTGLSAEVLRQWERRYGFPKPQRTPGGHRLYTPEEVEALRTIRRWLEEGATPRAAIQRWLAQGAGPEEPRSLQEALQKALLSADLTQAEGLFRKALRLLGPEGVVEGLITPLLHEIGEAWHRGEIGVAEEHLATQFLRARLQELLDLVGVPGGPLYLVTTPPGERHELGAMALAYLLRRRGVRALYLGPDTPLSDLQALAQALRARGVLLSVLLPEVLAGLPEGALAGLAPLVVLGGQGATEEAARRLGALYARNLDEVLELLEVRDEEVGA